MKTMNLNKRLKSASRKFLAGMALALLSAPFALIPLLKLGDVASPSQEFAAWLWQTTPDISLDGISSGAMSSGETVAVVGFFLLVAGLFLMYLSHKEWLRYEKFRDEAEKRLLIDGYAKSKTSAKD